MLSRSKFNEWLTDVLDLTIHLQLEVVNMARIFLLDTKLTTKYDCTEPLHREISVRVTILFI